MLQDVSSRNFRWNSVKFHCLVPQFLHFDQAYQCPEDSVEQLLAFAISKKHFLSPLHRHIFKIPFFSNPCYLLQYHNSLVSLLSFSVSLFHILQGNSLKTIEFSQLPSVPKPFGKQSEWQKMV